MLRKYKIGNYLPLLVIVVVCLAFGITTLINTPIPNKQLLLDKYLHSQWFFPQSPRVISDGELYQIASIKLLEGAKPVDINPEVPPAIKYLFGLSYKYTQQFVPLNLIFYLTANIGFYWLALILLKSKQQVFLATLLFITSKLVIDQLSIVMFDLAQVTFFIFFQIAFTLFLKTKKASYLGMSGLLLGLFSATKFPLFTPPIISIVLLFLFLTYRKNKKSLFSTTTVFLFWVVVGYTTTFATYIISDGWQAFIRLQKWMAMFYLKGSKLAFIPGMAILTLLTGVFKGWWNTARVIMADNWSPIWSIGLVSALYSIRKKTFNSSLTFFYGLNLLLILLFMFIPFWPRYILLVLPFLVLAVFSLKLNRWILFLLMIIQLFQSSLNLFFPNPSQAVNSFKQSWQIMAEDDIYSLLNEESKQGITQKDFAYIINNFVETTQLTSVTLDIQPPTLASRFSTSTSTPYHARYCTTIGCWDSTGKLELFRSHNKWQLSLDWQIIHPVFTPQTQVTIVQPDQEGWLMVDNEILGELSQSPTIFVIPDELVHLSIATSSVKPLLESSFFEPINRFSPGKKVVNIGSITQPINTTDVDNLKKLDGIKIECRLTQFLFKPNTPNFGKLFFDEHEIINHPIPKNTVILSSQDHRFKKPKSIVHNSYCKTKLNAHPTSI